MKKINNLKEKLLVELKNLKDSRRNIEYYSHNFMNNFYENTKLMHYLIKETKKSFPFEVAYRQYFVFLVSCWETYFRDIFILCYTLDEKSMNSLLNQFHIDDKIKDKLENNQLSIIDLISKQYNFQNLDSINNAFSILLNENDFFEYIIKTKISKCYISDKKVVDFSLCNIITDYQTILKIAFETRHKVIHDASYRPEIDISLISKIETLFLFLPQITTFIIAQKFNLPILIMDNNQKETLPFFFKMKDILSEDWEIIEE